LLSQSWITFSLRPNAQALQKVAHVFKDFTKAICLFRLSKSSSLSAGLPFPILFDVIRLFIFVKRNWMESENNRPSESRAIGRL
jgi:hypothetical protein